MKRTPLLALARLLCLPAALLLFSATAGAEGTSLFQYSEQSEQIDLNIEGTEVAETSAECEARMLEQAAKNAQTLDSKATSLTTVSGDCRSRCLKWEAPAGHKWYGKAPTCSGDKLEPNTKAYKNCTDIGGQPVDWSYCGAGKTCLSGNKILCKLPSDDYYEELAGVEGTVTWFGKPPSCNAKNAGNDCKAAGGTVAMESKCSDGSSGQKADCCTTGKMVACVLPKPEPTTYQGEVVETYVKWFGKGPACVAANGESDCANLGGTVEKKDKCTDGTDGEKKTCCTTGKKVKCIVPKITGG